MKINKGGADKWVNSIMLGAIFSCSGFFMRSTNKLIIFCGFCLLWILFATLIKLVYEHHKDL